ncbi:colanic acid biosynthesis acetyltransferase WcaF [Mucilaginibacter terrenus]|uniref:Colanic acid biosynthesis acetyltransferase WcaF n=1 Tax=Mucilaginibacter terrenus TaxID=2482727 RepID=A0A3E2NMQ7_9SPHI|nr:WcaF family extracellular polysaccharide biosynthesis acetyltransferase [Mucilaginibacter terrenus]RFZ82251.1 colanic acid biosynthesis acetyltransferase WcaF [Mucilaginibacter terrenus]
MGTTKLSEYDNAPYHPGGSAIKRLLWFYVNAIVFKTSLLPINAIKVALLKLFGAKLGSRVVIKPCVNIKYPWHLVVGNDTWIGEGVWIDNLVPVTIGSDICISQGAILQTGSHNYKQRTFDLITGNIVLADGAWIGCCAIINQGITVGSHAVLTAGSVATKNLDAFGIYQGNPAVKVRERTIE